MTYKEDYIRNYPTAGRKPDGTPYGCPPDRQHDRACPRLHVSCKDCWERKMESLSDDGRRLVGALMCAGGLAIVTILWIIWG